MKQQVRRLKAKRPSISSTSLFILSFDGSGYPETAFSYVGTVTDLAYSGHFIYGGGFWCKRFWGCSDGLGVCIPDPHSGETKSVPPGQSKASSSKGHSRAMVMTSTVTLLHTLPLFPAVHCNLSILPRFSLHATTTAGLFLLCRASITQPHSFQPKSLPSPFRLATPGPWFAHPKWVRRRELVSGPKLRCCSVTMAGASTTLPPMYRANVGICLINPTNQIFVAQRLDVPGAWQMPQGGIDGEEDPRAAALRELKEETGVTSAEYLGEVPEWLTYDFPPDVKAKLTTLWGTEWNGQAQKWFFFRFTGNDSEINLLGDGSENPEFSEWKWVPFEAVIKNAVEFKKGVYERVFTHLVKLIN